MGFAGPGWTPSRRDQRNVLPFENNGLRGIWLFAILTTLRLDSQKITFVNSFQHQNPESILDESRWLTANLIWKTLGK